MTMKARYWLVMLPLIAVLGACTGKAPRVTDIDGYPDDPRDIASMPDAVPKHEPRSKYGNPESYHVLGKTYHTLDSSEGFKQRGVASFYGTKFHGRRTSSGETYDMYKMTAAHKTLPLPTYVEVTNLDNGRRVVVKVNDRGPFHSNRIIDLSYAAAVKLGVAKRGTGRVEIRAIDPDNSVAHRQESGGKATHQAAGRDANLYVQAGAFSLRTNAETLRRRLSEEQGRDAVIRSGDTNGRKMYRVILGPLASADEAETLREALLRTGITGAYTVVD